ncbi:Pc13g00950 [Penicillium rubens Wisconsin 54-1255]|uniref:Pc13g00950 protein n=1 Tax=Penicillium rubens (strain ATCC 28089 / DSM 1075 / NRRL 1951 / Wisconsin 54-1255) TaxID=500485 RepID=B6H1A1_PENRW|nr:Pc13g00950 [Penicillium rubens Wisconsin 54-1255]
MSSLPIHPRDVLSLNEDTCADLLQEAQMIESFEVQENRSNAEVDPLESLGAVTSPKSDAAYPTPPLSVASPPLTSSNGRITQHQPIGTPLSTDSPYASLETTPTGPATPFGSDAIYSSYPTPSTSYVNSPPAEESCTLQGLRIPSQSRFRYLQSGRAGKNGTDFLEQIKIEKILSAEDSLLAQEPSRLLQPLLECSEAGILPSLKALRLPVEWKGKGGAVKYYRLLEAVKEKTLVLSPLAKRIAQILFYLNCTWLEKHGQLGATVATFILNACPEEPNTPERMKSRRDNITGCHKRPGKRCWMLVACLGAGVLLHGADAIDTVYVPQRRLRSPQLTRTCSINSNFTIPQLNIFITFVLRTRPGTVHLLRSLDTVVEAIMLGASIADLRGVFRGITDATVRQAQLASASAADQEAWTEQMTEDIWQAMDAESIAKKKIPDIIRDF